MSAAVEIADLAPSGAPPTLYAATAPAPDAPRPLDGDAAADVVVIGGGLAGLSAAFHLAGRGRSVVLLEAAIAGAGASGRNGGQVHSGQRIDQQALEAMVGEAAARRLWWIGEEAKQLVRTFAAEDADGCFLREGLILAAARPAHFDELARQRDHLAARYGYTAAETIAPVDLPAAIGTGRYHGGLRDGGAFHLDPWRLARALAGCARAAGVRLHEGTRATSLAETGRGFRVTTAGGPTVAAGTVVVAANGYLGRLVPAIAAHVLPLQNYVLATAPLPPDRFAGLVPGGEAVADTRFVVRYWRPTHDRRLVFGGGETYGRRFPADIRAFVRRHLLEVYPGLADVAIDHAWGGTLAITPTRAPFVRRLSPGLFTACGFSGQGVATATLSGRILAEAICGAPEALEPFARLPVPRFPGGTRLRCPLLALAMTFFALPDRMGL